MKALKSLTNGHKRFTIDYQGFNKGITKCFEGLKGLKSPIKGFEKGLEELMQGLSSTTIAQLIQLHSLARASLPERSY